MEQNAEQYEYDEKYYQYYSYYYPQVDSDYYSRYGYYYKNKNDYRPYYYYPYYYPSDYYDSSQASLSGATLQSQNTPQQVEEKKLKRKDVESKRYACVWPNCNRSYYRPSSLRNHYNMHTGERPFVCPNPGCGRAFSVNSNMLRHIKICNVGDAKEHESEYHPDSEGFMEVEESNEEDSGDDYVDPNERKRPEPQIKTVLHPQSEQAESRVMRNGLDALLEAASLDLRQ